MKKIIFAIAFCVFFLTINTFSQIFAPIGATWYFNKQEQVTFDAHGYTKFIVEKDTTINSKKMFCITGKEHSYDNKIKNLSTIYIYVADSQVYKLTNNKLKLVYDFTLQIGDTLKLDKPSDEMCDSITPIILDSIGILVANKDSIMVQYFSYKEKYKDDDKFYDKTYTVIEKIGTNGNVNDFLQTNKISSYESSPVNILLRCYDDESIHYKAKWINKDFDCDYLINKVGVAQKKVCQINFYPNPVYDILHIDCIEKNLKATVFNAQGNIMMQVTNKNNLNVQNLCAGVYFLKLSKNDDELEIVKFLKK